MNPTQAQNPHQYKEENVSLVVMLHLREKLGELLAYFVSDSSLQQQILRTLPLQLDLQLFQQSHRLPLRSKRQEKEKVFMLFMCCG